MFDDLMGSFLGGSDYGYSGIGGYGDFSNLFTPISSMNDPATNYGMTSYNIPSEGGGAVGILGSVFKSLGQGAIKGLAQSFMSGGSVTNSMTAVKQSPATNAAFGNANIPVQSVNYQVSAGNTGKDWKSYLWMLLPFGLIFFFLFKKKRR